MAAAALTSSDYVQIKLRSDKKHRFTDKLIVVHRRTGFVMFSNFVKMVCNSEDDAYSIDVWNKVLTKMTATKYMFKNQNLFVSSAAVGIILDEYKDSSKDTWGTFFKDGFEQLTKDLNIVMSGGFPVETPPIDTTTAVRPSTSCTPLAENIDSLLDAREKNIKQNEETLRVRHELLEAREAVILAREKTMNQREAFFAQKETEFLKKYIQYKKNKDALDIRSKELDERSSDLQEFMDKTLFLAKQFSDGTSCSSSKKKTSSKVHFNIHHKQSSSVSPSLTSTDSIVKTLLMVKKVGSPKYTDRHSECYGSGLTLLYMNCPLLTYCFSMFLCTGYLEGR